MHRLLLFLWLFVVGLGWSATGTAQELPPRPSPFQFLNDQAQLLPPANAKTLESGLRRYADETGTQMVVVTVPSLGGRSAAEYARALGTAWGIGQRDKNNGLVVLLSAQDRQVTIQAGSGLQDRITPELTQRVIREQMTPSFKQGRYFAGLRTGLNTLMLAANPSSDPRQNQPAAAATPSSSPNDLGTAPSSGLSNELPASAATPDPMMTPAAAPEPATSGFGIGTLVLGVVVIGGGIWLVSKLFRRRGPAAPSAPGTYGAGTAPAPDFLPRQPNAPAGNYGPHANQPGGAPDFLPNRNSGFGGGGGGLGSGMGGMLMTGAAAAAGAYLGNRMAEGHDRPDSSVLNPDTLPPSLGHDAAAGAIGGAGAASGGFPALDNTGTPDEAGPDYFSEDYTANEPDYFSSDDASSYDDMSSDDTGGGGFDGDDDNSGSW
ncbi:putative membrane protein YgcG [Hymenobacter luteus]|uniref:Membrane protein YgcG n=2 Tax=Hymenobacter TaxID=89966 RepID=A0ABR6JRQ4_9BACT|nr:MULTISPECIES: TPM domain-containing protein [Hymenobacter]MBB4599507.1 putative membrane protein YgcG [Hymenobacter latericoloratus]MBB6058183.1 putative membrane protein YgcG [Hymenobacter luteus]